MGEYRRIYPRKVEITRMIAAAKAAGLDVAGIEVSPDGSIKLIEARAMPSKAMTEFERMEAAGLI